VVDTDRLYSQLVAQLANRLKASRFRRSGTTFFRPPVPPATNWVMVNLQTLKVPGARDFIVNYGIISPALLRTVDGWLAPAPTQGELPKRRAAQLEWRLSPGWDDRAGYSMERWWRIPPGMSEADIDALASDVAERINAQVLPRLEPLATDAGLRDYYLGRLDEPDGLAPIDVGRLLALLELVGPADEIEAVRDKARTRMAQADERRAEAIADFEPFIGDVVLDYLQRTGRARRR
jgi:hypothetical protein